MFNATFIDDSAAGSMIALRTECGGVVGGFGDRDAAIAACKTHAKKHSAFNGVVDEAIYDGEYELTVLVGSQMRQYTVAATA